ncbi:MAG TPA: hypothetical protein VE935_03490 [Burkholderiales bacterium]|nr:hypothetical protein [Burkholderiales bacterium]
MRRALFALAVVSLAVAAHEEGGTRELVGQVGSRAAVLTLHSTRNPDASWRLAGEYVLLPTQERRFVEGESSPEIGVTTLREGSTPILFGHPSSGELRGLWRDGSFRGTRYAPGGQERERFSFSEEFPSLAGYSGTARCNARDGAYASQLAFAVEAGAVRSFEWSAQVDAGGQSCRLANLVQQPMQGGLQLASGGCRVTLRDLGESLRVAAENCAAQCAIPGGLQAVLVDRRGNCELFRPQARQP